MTDYYKMLGIEKSASLQEVKKAYRKLSLKFHPDKNDGDIFFENMFKQIQEAYEILGDIKKKEDYDRKLNNQKNNYYGSHSNFEPVIDYFENDKTLFCSGDEIKFKWKTYNADLVEIKPFGEVSIVGNKTYKLNNVSKQFLIVELKATNTNISKYVTKQIILENKILRDAKYHETRKSEYSNINQELNLKYTTNLNKESFWSIKGRLRRRDYLVRVMLLVIAYTIAYSVLGNYFNEDSVFHLILFAGCFLILAIQTIKRLHDINMSGWWYITLLIPLTVLYLGLIVFVEEGTRGTNKFGLDPKSR